MTRPLTRLANSITVDKKPIMDSAFSFALAKLLAYQDDDLPTTIDGIERLYTKKEAVVLAAIDRYNRETICPIDEVRQMVKSFFRYFMALRNGMAMTVSVSDIPYDLTNIGYYIDRNTLDTIESDRSSFYTMVRAILPVIETMVSHDGF